MQTAIEAAFQIAASELGEAEQRLFQQFKAALNQGKYRAAEPDASTLTGAKITSQQQPRLLLCLCHQR